MAKLMTLPNVQPTQTIIAEGRMPCVAAAARFRGVVGMNMDTVQAATASTMMRGARLGFCEDQSCTAETSASDMCEQLSEMKSALRPLVIQAGLQSALKGGSTAALLQREAVARAGRRLELSHKCHEFCNLLQYCTDFQFGWWSSKEPSLRLLLPRHSEKHQQHFRSV